MRKTPLICLCGPSGVGKTAVSYELEQVYGLRPVISHTSRSQRFHEVDGKDYHFRSKAWMSANRELFGMDWREFNGSYYGAQDHALLHDDVIVINSEDVAVLRGHGLPVFFIWLEGPIRDDRARRDDICWRPEYVNQVNHVLHNREGRTLRSCADEIHMIYELIRRS